MSERIANEVSLGRTSQLACQIVLSHCSLSTKSFGSPAYAPHMREVEYFRWWVRAPGRKRAHLTDFLMDAETAKTTYPGARPDPTSRTIRRVPEKAERTAQFDGHPAGLDGVNAPKS